MVFPKGPPVDISGLQDLIFFPRGSSLLQLQNSVTSMEVTLTLKSAQPNAVFFHRKKVVNKYTQNGRTIQVFRICNYCPNIAD